MTVRTRIRFHFRFAVILRRRYIAEKYITETAHGDERNVSEVKATQHRSKAINYSMVSYGPLIKAAEDILTEHG